VGKTNDEEKGMNICWMKGGLVVLCMKNCVDVIRFIVKLYDWLIP